VIYAEGVPVETLLNVDDPRLQARNEELVAKAAAKAGATVERIVAELPKIAFIGCGEIAAVRRGCGRPQCAKRPFRDPRHWAAANPICICLP